MKVEINPYYAGILKVLTEITGSGQEVTVNRAIYAEAMKEQDAMSPDDKEKLYQAMEGPGRDRI